MSSLFDGLDGASDDEIRGLMRDVTRAQADRVQEVGKGASKLRIRLKRSPKGPLRGFEPEIININDDVEVTVRLPGYMVAEIQGNIELELREALREHLRAKGIWAQPRFLMDVAARTMRARNQFTRRSRLG